MRSADGSAIEQVFLAEEAGEDALVVVKDGEIACAGVHATCASLLASLEGDDDDVELVDLHGGALSPALTSYGSPLGTQEIQGEPSTSDGVVPDPLRFDPPALLSGGAAVVHAVDGLQFATRDALYVSSLF